MHQRSLFNMKNRLKSFLILEQPRMLLNYRESFKTQGDLNFSKLNVPDVNRKINSARLTTCFIINVHVLDGSDGWSFALRPWIQGRRKTNIIGVLHIVNQIHNQMEIFHKIEHCWTMWDNRYLLKLVF